MKLIVKLVVLTGLLSSSLIFAHEDIELVSSNPSNNEMLMKSPENLVLEFKNSVRLIKLTLSTINGDKIDFGFKPSKEKKANYQWILPDLKPATYRINWSILGDDGHVMKDSLGFMVH